MKRTPVFMALVLIALGAAPLAGAQVEEPTIVYYRSVDKVDRYSRYEIYSMKADGTEETRLTDNRVEDAFPALSPDGQRIAFSRKLRGQYELYVMNVDGTEQTRLTRTRNGDEVLPSWSPGGKHLAFTATTATPDGWQSDIYRMRLEGHRTRRLTFTPVLKEFAPDWAPDGSEIAFTKQNQRRHRYGIAAVRANGEDVRWVVINPRSGDGYTDANPSWSPDSQWLTFARDHGDDPYVDIYKVRRDGSEVTAVTELSSLAENPVWGDDGRIIFMHNEGIAVVSSDGGEVTTLTQTRTGLPYWWPDW